MKTQTLSGLFSDDKMIFEKSHKSRKGVSLPKRKFPQYQFNVQVSNELQRKQANDFPELSEPEVIRHYVNLSKKNFSIDTHFYPLGSCTMKYNPKVNEEVARYDGFAATHPYQPEATVQGNLKMLHELTRMLCEITGMDEFTLQPAAGAHGEMTGLMLVHAYHHARGETNRRKVIVPDSSHGTNPATAALCGFEVVQIPSDKKGRIDLEILRQNVNSETACLMLTNPNTLGLFETDILEIKEILHSKGALLYYDGANLNALLGIARPGDMGFDIVHLNLHKTFSTPHGGGGPGAGPVGVKKYLADYLPVPFVENRAGKFVWNFNRRNSIGKIKSFYGNFGLLLRAYVYIRSVGIEGLKQISRDAILNANYIRKKVETFLKVPYSEFCMHEFVATAKGLNPEIHASDIGKRLLDYGVHAPTVHFPLVVEDALMIEPTESESKVTLDRFIDVLAQVVKESRENPSLVKMAPHTMPIKRPDEVLAARKPILSWRDYKSDLGTFPA